jgi:predicted Rossmann fold flavoprotein
MSALEERRIVVVGAGAAGLWAARVAAAGGADVLLLEKTRRAGTKILASGGTRCNLTTTLDAAGAGRLYGPAGERFLRPALRALSPKALVERFGELGVPCVEAPLEKVFPASQRARDVRDALEAAARSSGVEIRCEQRVVGVRALPGAGYEVRIEGAPALRAVKLLLAPGGRSFPGSGTTGDGYPWLASLGLSLVEPVPALVPLCSTESWVRELAGIAVQDAEVRLCDASGKERLRRRRPVLFTHEGVSGPGAMDVSRVVAREQARHPQDPPAFALFIDLCAATTREALRDELVDAAHLPGAPRLAKALGARFPRRLVEAVCAQAWLAPNPPIREITKAQRHELVEAFKGLRVLVTGTAGFERAEVTSGGLCLRELNPRTLEVNRYPGLYVIGELLDVDGPIGGFNFQSAFSTAELAARHALIPDTP